MKIKLHGYVCDDHLLLSKSVRSQREACEGYLWSLVNHSRWDQKMLGRARTMDTDDNMYTLGPFFVHTWEQSCILCSFSPWGTALTWGKNWFGWEGAESTTREGGERELAWERSAGWREERGLRSEYWPRAGTSLPRELPPAPLSHNAESFPPKCLIFTTLWGGCYC